MESKTIVGDSNLSIPGGGHYEFAVVSSTMHIGLDADRVRANKERFPLPLLQKYTSLWSGSSGPIRPVVCQVSGNILTNMSFSHKLIIILFLRKTIAIQR
jgi:hypothetical protein